MTTNYRPARFRTLEERRERNDRKWGAGAVRKAPPLAKTPDEAFSVPTFSCCGMPLIIGHDPECGEASK